MLFDGVVILGGTVLFDVAIRRYSWLFSGFRVGFGLLEKLLGMVNKGRYSCGFDFSYCRWDDFRFLSRMFFWEFGN